jgi:hypothetical protein
LRKPFGRRWAGSNLVWICGVAAGLLAGGVVAYGLASTTAAVAAHR